MILVKAFDDLTRWLNEEVCGKIELKVPDDNNNGKDYTPEFIHPAAFPLYVPGKDRLPPNVTAPIPSVCVQMIEGSDDLLKRKRQLKLRLCLSCWNPGEHGGETFQPHENRQTLGGYSYYRLDGPEAESYTRNTEGWRDVWNFADLVLREIESAEYIAGWRIAKEVGITYGPFTEDGVIWDYYPYWHSWITFTIEAGVSHRTPDAYKDFL